MVLLTMIWPHSKPAELLTEVGTRPPRPAGTPVTPVPVSAVGVVVPGTATAVGDEALVPAAGVSVVGAAPVAGTGVDALASSGVLPVAVVPPAAGTVAGVEVEGKPTVAGPLI